MRVRSCLSASASGDSSRAAFSTLGGGFMRGGLTRFFLAGGAPSSCRGAAASIAASGSASVPFSS